MMMILMMMIIITQGAKGRASICTCRAFAGVRRHREHRRGAESGVRERGSAPKRGRHSAIFVKPQ